MSGSEFLLDDEKSRRVTINYYGFLRNKYDDMRSLLLYTRIQNTYIQLDACRLFYFYIITYIIDEDE